MAILALVFFAALVIPIPEEGETLYWALGSIALGLGVLHGFWYLWALRGRE